MLEFKECAEFSAWLKTAKPNSKYTYHLGFSLTDSLLSAEIRKIAWNMACKGDIYLVQKKIQRYEYKFIAVKASSPPIKRLVPFTESNKLSKKWYPNRNKKPITEHLEISEHG